MYHIAYLALPKNNSEDLTPLAVDSVINLVNEYDDSLLGISFGQEIYLEFPVTFELKMT